MRGDIWRSTWQWWEMLWFRCVSPLSALVRYTGSRPSIYRCDLPLAITSDRRMPAWSAQHCWIRDTCSALLDNVATACIYAVQSARPSVCPMAHISKWLTMSSTDAAVVRVGKPEERYTYLKRGSCGVMWSTFCSSQRGRNGKRNPRSRSAGLESKGITGGGVMNAETTAIIPLLCIHSVPGNIQLTWVIGWRHNCHSPRSAWSAAVIPTIISHQRTKTDAWTVDWWRRPRTASSAVEDEQLRQSFKPHLHHTNWTQLTCSELQSRRFPCNCFVVDCVGLLCSHSKLSKC